MSLLVLGAGYIGSALAELALARGLPVVLADNWRATDRGQLAALERRGERADLGPRDPLAQSLDRLTHRPSALDLRHGAAELDRQRAAGAARDLAEHGRRAATRRRADRKHVERVR
jgi:nucleoside-diphosphate-sugar epimerase